MDESMKQTIYETTSEVFETMFFTFLEPLSEVPPSVEGGSADYVEALISYTGNINGTVRFYFPIKLANHITLNFLAVEDEADLNDRQVVDTVGETANMAIGSLLGKIDPEGSCALAIPEAKKISDFSPDTLASGPDLFVFNTEYGLLWMDYQET